MPNERERDELSANIYEADTEVTGERARAGLEHVEEGHDDDASGLALSPFNRIAEGYRLAIAGSPDNAEVHYYFGMQYFQCGLYERAAAAFRRVIEIVPELAEAHHRLAGTFVELGRYEDAIKSYEKALTLDDKLLEARIELDTLMRKLNDKQTRNES